MAKAGDNVADVVAVAAKGTGCGLTDSVKVRGGGRDDDVVVGGGDASVAAAFAAAVTPVELVSPGIHIGM